MNASRAWASVGLLLGLLAGAANAESIETVPVGDGVSNVFDLASLDSHGLSAS